jgi:hypothetical protein
MSQSVSFGFWRWIERQFTAAPDIQEYCPTALLAYLEQILIGRQTRYLEPENTHFGALDLEPAPPKHSLCEAEAADARIRMDLWIAHQVSIS